MHRRCPQCWSERLEVLSRRDYIEGFRKGLIRRVQGWFGAPLYYCWRCRLQFYDARPQRYPDGQLEDQALADRHSTLA
ncbi:MAG: hypothetical protein ABSH56_29760 [Bryobacteraceae bacterium]|jgi:hypothetical protein